MSYIKAKIFLKHEFVYALEFDIEQIVTGMHDFNGNSLNFYKWNELNFLLIRPSWKSCCNTTLPKAEFMIRNKAATLFQ